MIGCPPMLSHPDVDVVVMVTTLPTLRAPNALVDAAETSTRPATTLRALVVRPRYRSEAVVLIVSGLAELST
jgi:hypothetical protein